MAVGAQTPEDGIDCDQNNFTITGGIILGIGRCLVPQLDQRRHTLFTYHTHYCHSLSSVVITVGNVSNDGGGGNPGGGGNSGGNPGGGGRPGGW